MHNYLYRDFEKLQVKFSGLGPIMFLTNLLVAPLVEVLTPIIKKAAQVAEYIELNGDESSINVFEAPQ